MTRPKVNETRKQLYNRLRQAGFSAKSATKWKCLKAETVEALITVTEQKSKQIEAVLMAGRRK